MHEVIGHTGVVLRLDAWRVEANKQYPECESFDEFASKKPSLEILEDMARQLVTSHVAHSEYIFEAHCKAERDMQRENVLLMQQYFLLYKELSWAMNEGDIG